MAPYFFRVEHDLLRSESFKALGGSAIKVYLTIASYSDFGSDWAYPSIRTIAAQAELSRQTVLAAIEELSRRGLLATSKSKGRSTAYKIMRQAPPERPPGKTTKRAEKLPPTGLDFLEGTGKLSHFLLDLPKILVQVLSRSWPNSSARLAPSLGPNKNKDQEKTRQTS